MKLADALSLRKVLNRHVGVSMPGLYTQKSVIVPAGENLRTELEKLTHLTVTSFLERNLYYQAALETVDDSIQQANATSSVSIPSYCFLNHYGNPEKASKIPVRLSRALLLRKKLGGIVPLLTTMVGSIKHTTSCRQSSSTRPNIHGGTGAQAPNDHWTVDKMAFDPDEATHALRFYSDALREVDSAIQQANWTIELDLPESVNAIFIPGTPVTVPLRLPVS
jgi:hypothetical protein